MLLFPAPQYTAVTQDPQSGTHGACRFSGVSAVSWGPGSRGAGDPAVTGVGTGAHCYDCDNQSHTGGEAGQSIAWRGGGC